MDIKQQDIIDKKAIIGKPLSTIYEFYLVGDIESPEHYTEWFDMFRCKDSSNHTEYMLSFIIERLSIDNNKPVNCIMRTQSHQ